MGTADGCKARTQQRADLIARSIPLAAVLIKGAARHAAIGCDARCDGAAGQRRTLIKQSAFGQVAHQSCGTESPRRAFGGQAHRVHQAAEFGV